MTERRESNTVSMVAARALRNLSIATALESVLILANCDGRDAVPGP